jgi:hypothetical protein
MSAEPTLAEQLREMIVPPACVELIEQAAVRLDDLERQIAKVQYWRDRHCRESEQHAQRSGENWKAWKAAERQLATVAQVTIKQCATAIDPTQYPNECDRAIAWKCYGAIRALAPHAGKQLTALIDELAALPGLSKLPLLPEERARPAPTSGPVCEDCDGELEGQLIEAILIEKTELNRLRTVAEAAKAWLPYCYAGTESSAQSVLDNFVAAVRALERGEVKS